MATPACRRPAQRSPRLRRRLRGARRRAGVGRAARRERDRDYVVVIASPPTRSALRVARRGRHRSVHASEQPIAADRLRSTAASTCGCRARSSPTSAHRAPLLRTAGAAQPATPSARRVLSRRTRTRRPNSPTDAELDAYLATRIARARSAQEAANDPRASSRRMLDHSVLKPESTQADIRAGVDVVRALADRLLLRAAVLGDARGTRARRHRRARRQRRRLSARLRPRRHQGARGRARRRPTARARSTWCMNIGALQERPRGYGGRGHRSRRARGPGHSGQGDPRNGGARPSEEKRLACRLAVDAGAAFVKTSTGFHPAAARPLPTCG